MHILSAKISHFYHDIDATHEVLTAVVHVCHLMIIGLNHKSAL